MAIPKVVKVLTLPLCIISQNHISSFQVYFLRNATLLHKNVSLTFRETLLVV